MMKQQGQVVLAVMMLLAAAGCRASVRQVRVERVDQDLSSGNRGYVVGTPPAVADRGTPTRAITELEVELPSGATRARGKRVAPQSTAPTAEETVVADLLPPRQGTIEFLFPESGSASEPESASAAFQPSAPTAGAAAPATFERYTVKKGDSLWKLAKRFYGDAYQWRRIYDANRDRLSNPDHVRPGMTLNIPTAGSSSPQRASAQPPEAMQTASMESELK